MVLDIKLTLKRYNGRKLVKLINGDYVITYKNSHLVLGSSHSKALSEWYKQFKKLKLENHHYEKRNKNKYILQKREVRWIINN